LQKSLKKIQETIENLKSNYQERCEEESKIRKSRDKIDLQINYLKSQKINSETKLAKLLNNIGCKTENHAKKLFLSLGNLMASLNDWKMHLAKHYRFYGELEEELSQSRG